MRITKSNAHNYVIQVAALVRCFRLVRLPQHAVADNAKERFYTAPKTNVVAQAVVWNSTTVHSRNVYGRLNEAFQILWSRFTSCLTFKKSQFTNYDIFNMGKLGY